MSVKFNLLKFFGLLLILHVITLSANADDLLAQWYTGALLPPAPAESHQGMIGVEPYFRLNQSIGQFGANGAMLGQKPHKSVFQNSTMWKYGVTDALSIQAHTVVSAAWKDDHGASSGATFGDLPIDAIYRFVNENPERHIPQLNLFLGVAFPTGPYQKLRSALEGQGTGAYVFRSAILSQSSYRVAHHILRVRVWNWFYRGLSSPSLRGLSSYGTTAGFRGNGSPGMSGQFGFSLEYHLTRNWVLVLDMARDWSNGAHVAGQNGSGLKVKKYLASTSDWQGSPEIEYNFSGHWGIVCGAPIYYAGHNTGISVAPQFAVNMLY